MGFTDVFLIALIIGGAAYLLYHSIWKKKGHCTGCSSGTCRISNLSTIHERNDSGAYKRPSRKS